MRIIGNYGVWELPLDLSSVNIADESREFTTVLTDRANVALVLVEQYDDEQAIQLYSGMYYCTSEAASDIIRGVREAVRLLQDAEAADCEPKGFEPVIAGKTMPIEQRVWAVVSQSAPPLCYFIGSTKDKAERYAGTLNVATRLVPYDVATEKPGVIKTAPDPFKEKEGIPGAIFCTIMDGQVYGAYDERVDADLGLSRIGCGAEVVQYVSAEQCEGPQGHEVYVVRNATDRSKIFGIYADWPTAQRFGAEGDTEIIQTLRVQ